MGWAEIANSLGMDSKVSRNAMLGRVCHLAWDGKDHRAYSEHARDMAQAWGLVAAAYADPRPWTHGERSTLKAAIRFLGVSQRAFEQDIKKSYPGIKQRRIRNGA